MYAMTVRTAKFPMVEVSERSELVTTSVRVQTRLRATTNPFTPTFFARRRFVLRRMRPREHCDRQRLPTLHHCYVRSLWSDVL